MAAASVDRLYKAGSRDHYTSRGNGVVWVEATILVPHFYAYFAIIILKMARASASKRTIKLQSSSCGQKNAEI